jgi:hypothetical protein
MDLLKAKGEIIAVPDVIITAVGTKVGVVGGVGLWGEGLPHLGLIDAQRSRLRAENPHVW